MTLLSGDSIALGLAAYIHHVKIDARPGRRSAEGAAHIRHYPDNHLYVSLGSHDTNTRLFRRRVRLIVAGRTCVAWVQIRNRPRLNRVLQQEGVHVVSRAGVRLSSGEGYRVLARRMTNTC